MTLRDDLERWLEYVDSDPEDMGGGKYLTPNEVRRILARDAKQARAVFESIDVDELARAVDPAVYPYLNRVTGKEWEACVKVATAIKAHLLDGERRG